MKKKYFIHQASEASEEKNECQRHQNWHFKPKFHDFSLIFHYYLQHFEKYRNLMEKYRIWDQNIGKIGSPENIGKNRSTGQPD